MKITLKPFRNINTTVKDSGTELKASREYSFYHCHESKCFSYQDVFLGRFILTEKQYLMVSQLERHFKDFNKQVTSEPSKPMYDYKIDIERRIPKAKSEGLICHEMRVNYNSDDFSNSLTFNINSIEEYDIIIFLFRVLKGALTIEIVTKGSSCEARDDILDRKGQSYSIPNGYNLYSNSPYLLSCGQVKVLHKIQESLIPSNSDIKNKLTTSYGAWGTPLPTVKKFESPYVATLTRLFPDPSKSKLLSDVAVTKVHITRQGEQDVLDFLLDSFPSIRVISVKPQTKW